MRVCQQEAPGTPISPLSREFMKFPWDPRLAPVSCLTLPPGPCTHALECCLRSSRGPNRSQHHDPEHAFLIRCPRHLRCLCSAQSQRMANMTAQQPSLCLAFCKPSSCSCAFLLMGHKLPFPTEEPEWPLCRHGSAEHPSTTAHLARPGSYKQCKWL